MAKYDELIKMLQGTQPEQRMSEEVMSVGQPAAIDAVAEKSAMTEAGMNPVEEIKTAQVNEVAKSPNMKTKEELVAQEAQLNPYQQILQKQNELQEQYNQDIKGARETDSRKQMLANLAKALGSLGAAEIQRGAGVKAGLKGFQPVGKIDSAQKELAQDRAMGLEKLKNELAMLQAGKKTEVSDLDKAKAEKLRAEAAVIKGKKDEPSWEQKEKKKFEMKQDLETQKANRKEQGELNKTVKDLDEQMKMVKDAYDAINELEKDSLFMDTGPVVGRLTPNITKEAQKAEQALNDLSLKKMSKLFEGMSKSIDSDAERAFFQQAQASMTKDPEVNRQILKKMMENFQSLKAKAQGRIGEISGEKKPQTSSDTVMLQAPDGTVKRVKREQAQKYIDKGATLVGN